MRNLHSLPILIALFGISTAIAQEKTGIIFTRGCYGVYDASGQCIDDPTPQQRREAEERDRAEKLKAEAERRAREARAAEHKRQVDEQTLRMGAHRRAEAENFVRMREAAEAARPKPSTPPESKQCNNPAYTTQWSTGGLTALKDAQTEYRALSTRACQGRGGKVGPIKCGKAIVTFGEQFASCSATINCAAYSKPCSSKVSNQ